MAQPVHPSPQLTRAEAGAPRPRQVKSSGHHACRKTDAQLDEATREAVRGGKAQASRGEFALNDDVAASFQRHEGD